MKFFLPDHSALTRTWRAPFRGAQLVPNPHDSVRKILELYEHDLNNWLEQAFRRVTDVPDVDANDCYFYVRVRRRHTLGRKRFVLSRAARC